MPILRLASRPTTTEAYQAAIDKIDLDHDHPLGLIMHGADALHDQVQVAQVWESEDYARRFMEDELEPALRAEGVPPADMVMIIELHHLVTP